jgi:PKD domain-containing protein/carboxypeptidase family protein
MPESCAVPRERRGSLGGSRRLFRALAVAALLPACSDSPVAGDMGDAPAAIEVTPISNASLRVAWTPVDGDVVSYEVQRRANLTGPFEVLVENLPPSLSGGRVVYFDNHVEPKTFYGYRVRANYRAGGHSHLSSVGGAQTASLAGIVVAVSTQAPNPESEDADGYIAMARGVTDTVSGPLGINDERSFSGLKPGTYSVVLRGIAPNCNISTGADSTKTVQVTSEGLNTVTRVQYSVTCRDPKRGRIVVNYEVDGDTTPPNGARLSVAGLVTEAGTPTNERVYFELLRLPGSEIRSFDNLRTGDYEVKLDDLGNICRLTSTPQKFAFKVKPLSSDTAKYSITCEKPPQPPDPTKPLVLSYAWSRTAAPAGDRVSLTILFDATARPAQDIAGVQASVRYNATVVRYDSARRGDLEILTANSPSAGLINFAALATPGGARFGSFTVGRLWFTVIGANGASTGTNTTLSVVAGGNQSPATALTRVQEARFTVGPSPANQNPHAEANGPYVGDAGTPISFSSTGSTDPDGSIASFAWTFGDGGTGTGPSPSHTYTAPGTYTVVLTVTDDRGGSAADNATVTISAPGPTTGTIAGTVTSSQGGGIANATVNVSGGFNGVTNAQGAYSIPNVATGSHSITLGALPQGCSPPTAVTTNVAAGATSTVNFTVTCGGGGGGTTGTVAGTITRSDNNQPISQVDVTLTPNGGAPLPVHTTGADGAFTFTVTVANGTGTITLGNLPAGCTDPGSVSYTGLTGGATLTKNITVTCQVATLGYSLTGSWGAITSTGPTGRQVQLTLQIDMGAAPGDPQVNGSNKDEFVGIQMALNYGDNTKIAYQARVFPDPNLDFGAAGSPSVGLTNISVSSSQGLTSNGVVTFARVTFNIQAGASGTVTPTVSLTQVLANAAPPNQVDVTSKVTANIPALIIP